MSKKSAPTGGDIHHMLICGVTKSGKTTLARELARLFAANGARIAVRDPVDSPTAGGGWPESARRFADDISFLEFMHSPEASGYVVFVDEASDLFGVQDKDLHWMFTRGRHFGLCMVAICQRPKMLAPNVRSQCTHAYLFRLAEEDTREIAADFGHSGLHKLSLDRGDFLKLESGTAAIVRGNVFTLLEGKEPKR